MLSIANVGLSNSTMHSFIDRVNSIADASTNQYLTANAAANGANNWGNTFMSGIYAGNVVAVFGQLRGGNVQSNSDLTISSNVIYCGTALTSNQTSTTTTTSNQIVDSFDSTAYRATKYVIQITNSTNYAATELMLTHDGSNVFITEYATLNTNTSLGIFSANIDSSTVNLLFSPVNAINTIKFTRTSLSV